MLVYYAGMPATKAEISEWKGESQLDEEKKERPAHWLYYYNNMWFKVQLDGVASPEI